MKKNSLKRKLIVIGGVILSVIIIIGAVVIVRELNAEKILKEEVNKITNLDFTVDEIDMHIKTTKDYAVVEKTIKEFWNEYHTLAREIIELTNDDKIKNILTIENYELDGKDFVSSKEYITNTQSKINENINKIIELTKKENIEKRITDKDLSSYYVDLYNELMIDYDIEEDISATVKELEDLENEVNALFTKYTKVIDFLVTNQASWTVTNGKLEFTSEALATQYNNLIKEN